MTFQYYQYDKVAHNLKWRNEGDRNVQKRVASIDDVEKKITRREFSQIKKKKKWK